jgi:hypothetical protein
MILPPIPIVGFAVYGLASLLGVYAAATLFFSSKAPRSDELHKLKSLPLTVTAIAEPEYRRHAGHQNGASEAGDVGISLLLIPPVFLINTSTDEPLAIRIYLAMTDELGARHRLEAETDAQRIALIAPEPLPNEYIDSSRPQWILSPAALDPRSALHGPIPFVLTSNSATPGMGLDAVAHRFAAHDLRGQPPGEGFKYALELQDTRSGLSISVPLPSDGYVAS